MKGQAAFEYAMIVGLILVILIPIFYISLNDTNNKIKDTQSSDVVNQIASAANTVYSLGPGATKYISVTIPKGVTGSEVKSNSIALYISLYNGNSSVTAVSKGNISGTIPTYPGTYTIILTNTGSNNIYIGNLNDTQPPIISNLLPVNGSTKTDSTTVRLSANTNEYSYCKYKLLDNSWDDGSMSFNFASSDGFDLSSSTLGQTTHTKDIGLTNNHIYTLWIKCNDTNGNLQDTPAKTRFTVNTNLDLDFPIIELRSPANNTQLNMNPVNFIYNVSDATSNIDNCSLNLYGKLDDGTYAYQYITDRSIGEIQNETIQATLKKGNYTWSLYCIDSSSSHNGNSSLERWIRFNSTTGQGTISSCQDFCVYDPSNSAKGYTSGGCDSSSACGHYTNPTYESGGNTFCPVPNSKSCCCTK